MASKIEKKMIAGFYRLSEEVTQKDARIAELEEALRPFAEMGPAFVECETLKGQILVILQRDDVERARALLPAVEKEADDEKH